MTSFSLSDHCWSPLSLIMAGSYKSLKQDIHFFIIIRHKKEKEKNVN